jgi:glycosyltransferase involved in cell wall biosynthesis
MRPQQGLVSVICLSFNQKNYVEEALQSILNQTYENIEIIVVDDASTDGTADVIQHFVFRHPAIQFIRLTENTGNCKAFNKGLKVARGEFIIDLAADDILLSNRVEQGVAALTTVGSNYGVNFSDAELIDEKGLRLNKHSDRFPHTTIPQGNLYRSIIERYFICPPTMMFRKAVIDSLGGYDETLAYEDFDFFVRASREYFFCYTPTVLVKRRLLNTSMSNKQFSGDNSQRWSTLKVCEKIEQLNKTKEEKNSLRKRIRYEFLLSIKMGNFKLAIAFIQLYFRLSSPKTMLT